MKGGVFLAFPFILASLATKFVFLVLGSILPIGSQMFPEAIDLGTLDRLATVSFPENL